MFGIPDREEFLTKTVIKLMKRGALANLRNLIDKTHVADLAHLFPRLVSDEKLKIAEFLIEADRFGEAISEMNREEREFIFQSLPPETLVPVFKTMPVDDLNEVLAELPDDLREAFLNQIQDYAKDLQLMQYDEKTAGYIMTTDFVALLETTTAASATDHLRKMENVEMVFYVYVIDDEKRLKGVISLRQLVTTRPETPLKDLMTTRTYTVLINTPQEEVAQVVARYNVLAVPVLDDDSQMVGIVTIDDVIDVIREENTEDMLKMAGTGDVDLASKSIIKGTRARLPWLFASWIGGVIAATVISKFEAQLESLAALTAFIPIIMGMGGNIGTQSSTIIVRGLALGEIDLKRTWEVLWREFAIGVSLGGVYGLLLAIFAKLRFWSVEVGGAKLIWQLPMVVGIAICLNMIIAATVGTIIPMLFKRINIDPAVATGPFVTTSIDVFGILSYFLIAKLFLF